MDSRQGTCTPHAFGSRTSHKSPHHIQILQHCQSIECPGLNACNHILVQVPAPTHRISARIHPCDTHTYSVLRLARSVNSPAWMKSIWFPSKALSHIRRMRSVLCTTPSLRAHVQVQKRRQSRKHSVCDARDLVRSQRPVQHRT